MAAPRKRAPSQAKESEPKRVASSIAERMRAQPRRGGAQQPKEEAPKRYLTRSNRAQEEEESVDEDSVLENGSEESSDRNDASVEDAEVSDSVEEEESSSSNKESDDDSLDDEEDQEEGSEDGDDEEESEESADEESGEEEDASEEEAEDSRRITRSRRQSVEEDEDDSKSGRPQSRSRRVSRSGQPKKAPSLTKKKKKVSSTSSATGPLDIGAEVYCKWSGNNEEYPAKILKRRRASQEGSANAEEVDDDDDEDTEFYVRYLGFDHRLDEWVTRGRIREAPGGIAGSWTTSASPSPSASACSGDEGEVHQVKNIHSIELGKYEIETWYYSPYPEEYSKESKLFLCEFCLKYMKKRHTLERHAEKCDCRHPPGHEIYREGELSVFEVDGKKQRIYCQNLCLLSKLFLDHKTLYYDVDPFYFYILCECDDEGAHIVGYFSKEKYSPDGYNLACIMTLPPYQRKGYGSFLISLSYELSKRDGVVGSPEKPLSDLGRLGYRSYWSRIILGVLRENRGEDLSINDISKKTAIAPDDIIDTLKELKLVRYWKGKHVLVISPKLIDAYLDSTAGKRFRLVDPTKLTTWNGRRSVRVGSGETTRRRA